MELYLRNAVIATLKSMRELFPKAARGSLVIVDLDDTVHRSKTLEGSELFLDMHTKALVDKGLDEKSAFKKANAYYNRLHQQQPTSFAVDEDIDWTSVIAGFKDKNIHFIGLTARSSTISETTLKQMQSIGISFSDKAIADRRAQIDEHTLSVRAGVISTDELKKGDVLQHLLPHFNKRLKDYTAIHFVDDKRVNCQSVADFFKENRLNGFVYHYPKVSLEQLYSEEEVRSKLKT